MGGVVGVIVNRTERPMVGSVGEEDRDGLGGAKGSEFGGGDGFAKVVLEGSGVRRPIGAFGGLRECQFEEGLQESVEGFLPGTVVIELIGHFPRLR